MLGENEEMDKIASTGAELEKKRVQFFERKKVRIKRRWKE